MSHETIDDMAPVMGADGEFHAQDEAVDLSGTPVEAWVALGFFWLLGLTVFVQFFTRYVMNDSASWTEEIARYFLIATVFTGAAIGVAKNNSIIDVALLEYVLREDLNRRAPRVLLPRAVEARRVVHHGGHPHRIYQL